MEKFISPIQVILNSKGLPLSSGFLHIGVANLNPIVNHIPIYWDSAATKPATNPVKIKNGMLYNGASPATLFVGGDCSFAVVDGSNRVVMSVPTMDAGLSIPISRVIVDQDLDLNSHKVTEVAFATSETDGINLGQARNEQYRMATSVSGIDINAIIAVLSPPITSLVNGVRIRITIPFGIANTYGIVTFTPNSGVIAAKRVVVNGFNSIPPGAISYGIRELEYNSSLDKWVLLNPHRLLDGYNRVSNLLVDTDPVSHTLEIICMFNRGVGISFFTPNPGVMDTCYSFDQSFIDVSTMSIPYGATLGTKSGIPEGILLLAVLWGGKIYPALVNARGFSYDEYSVINTVGITSGSLSDGVVYANQVLSGANFRVLALIETTQTVAGQWDDLITRVVPMLNDVQDLKTFASTWTTPIPAAGVQLSASHSFGNLPFKAILEYKCLTAEQNYAIGDVAEVNVVGASLGLGIYKNATTVGALTPASTDFQLRNKTTGASFAPTKANWAYRFLLTR